eukprot:PLAT162.1.p1 GENE.PLAT162.1~~PLAT162.1.p1  ORF type:complete len:500 (+),score=156.40 PLAT162.1:260-1759(+)
MSSERESKADAAVAAGCSGGVEDAEHAAQRLPEEVWGSLLRFCSTADCMELSSTCSWLHRMVLRAIRFVELRRPLAYFPAARMTSLQHVQLGRGVDISLALPVLTECTQLRELELDCEAAGTAPVINFISLFPHLQSVSLQWAEVSGHLGRALVRCKALQHVKGFLYSSEEPASSFFHELSSLSTLRSLGKLQLGYAEDCPALCAAVGAWSKLEELSVTSEHYEDAAAEMDGLIAAVASGCPHMRRLFLSNYCEERPLTVEDVDSLARMSELQQLALSGLSVVVSLEPLLALTQLQSLRLAQCRVADDCGPQLRAVTRQLPLTSFTLSPEHCAAAVHVDVLGGIAQASRLAEVTLSSSPPEKTVADKDRLAAALAEAVCRSSVRDWQLSLPFSLLPFLRTWGGSTPAAAVSRLWLPHADSEACEGEEVALLLLSCLRSCPSLRQVSTKLPSSVVEAVVAAVRKEALAPTVLSVQVADHAVRTKYQDEKKALKEAGLVLH